MRNHEATICHSIANESVMKEITENLDSFKNSSCHFSNFG